MASALPTIDAANAEAAPSSLPPAHDDEKNYLNDRLGYMQTFSRVFHVFDKHLSCFLTISFLSVGLGYLLTLVIDIVNGPDLGADYNMEDLPEMSTLDSVATVVMSGMENLILYMTVCLNDAAIVVVVSEIYLGTHRPPTAVASIGSAAFKLVPLLGSCLLVVAMRFIPLFLMVIVCFLFLDVYSLVYVVVVLAFAWILYVFLITYNIYPAIIVENATITGSIRRSFNLADGYLMEIFRATFLLGIVRFVLATLIASMILVAPDSVALNVVGQILLFGVSVLFSSLSAILKSVVYFNIRVHKEGYNHGMLAEEMGQSGNQYVEMEGKKETSMVQLNEII